MESHHPVAKAPPSIDPSTIRIKKQPAAIRSIKPAKTDDQSGQLEIPDQESSLYNAQPLEVLTFPSQPRPGSQRLPATIDNIRHMLTRYHIIVRYNTIKKKLEILLPGHSGTIDNTDNVTMTYIISLATLNGLSIGQVPAYVEALADKNMYNPVAEWITSKPWDGKDRLPDIYNTITEREDYPKCLKRILIHKWLLSAVAAVLKPSGFKARGVLTFQGPQGIGKTSWIMSLVPDEFLRDMLVKVDHHLDGGNKDSIIGAVSHWLVEIGELDSSFKKDISRLKGFLTNDFDKIRRPYARTESEYPRRTVFFASVNKSDFLVDMTGNSRWWTIPVSKINYNHGIDMQQLFAQLAEDFKKDTQWWLTLQEDGLLDYCNREHRSVSVIQERLMEIVDLGLIGKDGHPAMTALEVLKKLGYDKPTNPQCKECGGILRELFGEHKRINGKNKWRIPLKPFIENYDDDADY
ncbi:MAG: VapE family protein [Thermodesulfobacteriota bacterium]|nr:VapE family protein [Thermodesulfobacteriota bacterium]